MNDSNKYLLAAGAVGGAVGYLFFTKSGRKVRDAVFNMENSAAIPEKIEDARRFIERRGQDVGGRIRGVVDHLKGSIDAGKRTFEQSGTGLQQRMQKLSQTNSEVVANIHRAIDNMSKTVQTVERSVLEPIYEMGSIVQGVQTGVKKLVQRERRELPVELRDTNVGVPATPFFRDPGRDRVMG